MKAALGVALEHVRRALAVEQLERLQEDVVEVHGARAREPLDVARVDLGLELGIRRERPRVHLGRSFHGVLRAADPREERARRPGRIVDSPCRAGSGRISATWSSES
jgi:hypothetical protein